MKLNQVRPEDIMMMNREALCAYYGVLPSQLDKEKADDIDMLNAIMIGRAKKQKQKNQFQQNNQQERVMRNG